MNDLLTEAQNILGATPLPADAEARIAALIAQMPESERPLAEMTLHEALFTAQQGATFTEIGSQALTFE